MYFTTSSVQLYKQLANASRIAPARTSMVLQENVLFTARKGVGDQPHVLEMLVSDMETTLLVSMPVASVTEEGTIGIPHRILLEMLKETEDTPLNFSADPNTLAITIHKGEGTARGEFHLGGYSVNEFPEMPAINEAQRLTTTTTCSTFLDSINRTIYAASKPDTAHLMAGILLIADPTFMRFVATDSNRIASLKHSNYTFAEHREVFLPIRPATLLSSVIPNDDKPLQIDLDYRNIQLTGDNFVLVCRLAEPMLPDYERAVPWKNEYTLTVEKVPFINAIRQVSPFSTKGKNVVTLQLTKDTVTVLASNEDQHHRAYQKLGCQYQGEDYTVHFRTPFLLDSLASITSPEVVITFSQSATGSLFLPTVERSEHEQSFSVLARTKI